MLIGSLPLPSNLCLAPLAGYTSLPGRLMIRKLGGLGLATTELTNARSLLENRAAGLKLIESRTDDQPLAVQLFGSVPEEMRDAAVKLQAMGAVMVDINMGCPVRKVCRVGGGSAMLTDLDKTAALVRQVVAAVKIPVTAKMRLGWDAANLTAPDLARALADVGIAAVTVHGRTREQGFGGVVSLAGIRAVVTAVPQLPVIGNGDVTTPEAARMMLHETGCAGVSIGRGALYNPWIFAQTQHFLRAGEHLPEPSLEDHLRVMIEHLDLMVEVFGEKKGCLQFRKIAPWYVRRLGPVREFNRRIVTLSCRHDLLEIIAHYVKWREQFLDAAGHLKPAFQPVPLPASFMHPTAPISAEALRVPKGPIERW